jgi:hypothetical protein
MQNVERSSRTGCQPGERPSLTSSRQLTGTCRRAERACTTDGSSCKTLPAGIHQRHGFLRTPCRRTGSDRSDDPSCRISRTSAVASNPVPSASLIHSESKVCADPLHRSIHLDDRGGDHWALEEGVVSSSRYQVQLR